MLRTIQHRTHKHPAKFWTMNAPRAEISVGIQESAVELVRAEFLDRLRQIQWELCETPVAEQDWLGLQQVLASLPLTTEEFGQAQNRLINARRYAIAAEFGAARFELRQLSNSMARVA